MTRDLLLALIEVGYVSTENLSPLLFSTYEKLVELHSAEAEESEVLPSPPSARGLGADLDWKASITRYDITCLECGDSLRQLSSRHLRRHDLDARSYRIKYGIPRTQPLSSRQATARRRELAQQIRPWEGAARSRQSRPRKRAAQE
ncbi:MAG: hypothetical protein ETSY2_48280 [Candidatus Entotheonella gemina]|uniref:MucR family transcriptional regulator n=1 Tax=Candidatus Entotheonella gemina TaxID=1429439 RepID=W4LBK2_9BACT|nr:MAG: hypothetical protein ETSY2_48280 [Candidatus Entotheonella gemina]